MTTKTATDPAAALRLAARETAIGLGAVARGKAETHTLESDAKTFKGIARILDGLNEQLEERDALVDKLVADPRRHPAPRAAELAQDRHGAPGDRPGSDQHRRRGRAPAAADGSLTSDPPRAGEVAARQG
jgi:hypothetical protein